ncbi:MULTISPECIES: cation:proton antiporter [Halobacterium]|uniref:Mrp-type sodium/proton antiporter system subunitF n=5 Tax=Halobacterium salinarum TaxID=2242 RepID=A0A510N4Y9_HALSA|nr:MULTISPECIES: cation:proton antiporter [Halobacterium]MBB6089922.1 multicomponent Na+:H+ antiporter subunit F [Halobacterium salinarum]MCF2165650.1 cation:proton antiporter [Halobacterium salinarum]MCF2168926.1 cation:proton antiporter [Halobacterium salinarum]MCF2207844.1 cation:proton antiporter [Halobacterium salinarum]MCF2238946.1 cation:proton antiporter [Halobacterium salinarum]
MTLLSEVLLAGAGAFILLSAVVLYRVLVGPTMQDRVIGVNAIGTNIVVILALVGAATELTAALDIAIVYALLNFLMSIAISKFTVERGGVL